MKRFLKSNDKVKKFKRRKQVKRKQLVYRQIKEEFKPYKPIRKKKDERIRKGRIALGEEYVKKGRKGGNGRGRRKGRRKGNPKGNPQNLVKKGNKKNLNRKGNVKNLNRKGRPKGAKDKNKRKQYNKKNLNRKGNVKNLNRKGRPKGAKDKKPRKKYERKTKQNKNINKKDLSRNQRTKKNEKNKKDYQNVIKERKGTIARKGNRIGRKDLFSKYQKEFRKLQPNGKPQPITKPIRPLSPISNFEDMVVNWDHIQDVLKEYNAIDHWISFTSRNPIYREWVGRVMERLGIDMDWELFIDYLVKIDNSTDAERKKLIEVFKDKRKKDYRNFKTSVMDIQDARYNPVKRDIPTNSYFAGYNPNKKIIVYDLKTKKGKK